jgi:hypothetical protein
VFLNTQYGGVWSMSGDAGYEQGLETVMKNAVMKVRNTLAGKWEMGVAIPDLANPNLPAGAEIALSGSVTLKYDGSKPVNFSMVDKSAVMNVGASDYDEELAEAGGLPNFDRRPAIRLPCGVADSCDWYPLYKTPPQAYPPYFQMFDGCRPRVCGSVTMTCGAAHAEEGTVCGILPDNGVCCGQGCWVGGDTGICG